MPLSNLFLFMLLTVNSNLQSLFDIIREAQKRRELRKANEKPAEPTTMPKGENIVTKSKEDLSKRPESH